MCLVRSRRQIVSLCARTFKRGSKETQNLLWRISQVMKCGFISLTWKPRNSWLRCEDHGPIPFDMFSTRCNITQFIYFWKTAVLVLGGISTHHQDHTQLYLQYLLLVKPLLLLAAIVDELELVWAWCGNCIDLFQCGCWLMSASAPKQINTIPTPHSNQLQFFHNSSR